MVRREDVWPLEKLGASCRRQIAADVALPDPPPRWHYLGDPDERRPMAVMDNRSWWEWHWARGIDPDRLRRNLAPETRRMVIARDGLHCGICSGDVEADDVHIDHRLPVARGGTDDLGNLQVTHSKCNLRKGARV